MQELSHPCPSSFSTVTVEEHRSSGLCVSRAPRLWRVKDKEERTSWGWLHICFWMVPPRNKEIPLHLGQVTNSEEHREGTHSSLCLLVEVITHFYPIWDPNVVEILKQFKLTCGQLSFLLLDIFNRNSLQWLGHSTFLLFLDAYIQTNTFYWCHEITVETNTLTGLTLV